MKKLIFIFALAIFLMPGIANAHNLNIREVSFRWNNNQKHFNTTDITSHNANTIIFNGAKRTSTTAFQWPYDLILFYLDKPTFDTTKTYDIDFVAFIGQNAGVQTSARVNGNTVSCTTVSESSNFAFFTCKNVKLVNNNNNYILISFKNNGHSSQNYFAGISKLNFVESSESNTDDILSYMTILEDTIKNQNQSIIDNANKNHHEQIENENKNHQETMDTITDSTVDSDDMTSLGGTDLPSNGALSAILNLPVQFFTTLSDRLRPGNYACKKVEATIPFVNQTFSMPCLNTIIRSMGLYDWWQSIGYLAGGVTLFFYLLYLGKQFDKMSKLKETNGEFGGL